MCRLVIRNRDKVNPDSPYLDAMCMKAGMVVDVLEDGQSLGKLGDQYDGWTVVELPGVTREDVTGFLTEEPGNRTTDKMLQRRAFKFDLAAWKAAGEKAALTLTEALDHQKPIAKRADPGVLGAEEKPL